MLRSVSRLSPFGLAISIPFLESGPDTITTSKFDSKAYEESLANESGWERIQAMFKIDDFGNISPDLNSVGQSSLTAAFVGACYGGLIRSRNSYLTFTERNEATIFKSPVEAKRKLQDQVTTGFGRGAFQWGWRMAAFTASYCGISTVISVYRGKSSIFEYMFAGLVTGALYKANLGLRGAVVGGGLGLALGTVGGAGTMLLLRLTGKSMEEIRFWQYKFKESRIRLKDQMMEATAKEKNTPLSEEHDRQLGVTKKLDPTSRENKDFL